MAKQGDHAAKWLSSMQNGNAATNYENGINATQVNPMAMAADAEDRYLAGVQEASASGRRKAKLMAVNVATWKANATGKGKQRLASGAAAAAQKVQAHFQKFGPAYKEASAAAAAIKGTGIEVALQKVRASIEVLKRAAGKPV
jgi:hypothetical protein